MREFIRNQLVRVLGSLGAAPWEDSDRPVYRFLTYHRVEPNQQVFFEQQLDRLQSHYNIVSPEGFRKDEGVTDTLNLVLTFDDGYLEWETLVIHELDKRDLHALFFVTPDFPGRTGDSADRFCRENLRRSPAQPVTTEGVRELQSRGHTLGNHLVGHPDLREETDEGTLREHFTQSQQAFRDQFGVEPEWVAYPFADYFAAPETISSVADEHFEFGVTLIPGWNRSGDDPLLLHRDGFAPDLGPAVEQNWLRGGYDPIFSFTHLSCP